MFSGQPLFVLKKLEKQQNGDMSYKMIKNEDFFEGKDGIKIH